MMKQRFMASGLIDWHLPHVPITAHIELQEQSDGDHDTNVMTAPPQLKQPPLYAVVVLNDDYTPMDFVIEILQEYFSLDLDHATQVMLTVHHTGKGIAGIYPRDIAETKANQVNNYARSQGHPLLCQIEPQE
ncbi:ATP-dependent Clp protease adapter ClpS [Acinetobacter qingfengensis]|nr:ATP-dependent Clp protease adapter ClpS [Acinetobacter qingfengensis]